MDNQRLLLIIALCFVGLLLFEAWQKDYGPKSQSGAQPTEAEAPTPTSSTPQSPSSAAIPEVPTASSTTPEDVPRPAESKSSPVVISGERNQLPTGQKIRVETDALVVMIDTHGGDIREVLLKKYPKDIDSPNDPFILMTDTGARFFIGQTGFSMLTGKGPTHESEFQAEKTEYVLADEQDSLTVNLSWTSDTGVKVIKSFVFKRANHAIVVRHTVENSSAETWKGSFYRQLQRTQFAEDNQSQFIYTYMGGVIYTPENRYEKIDFAEMQEENLQRENITHGWVAMMQHYFLGAWVPDPDEVNKFYSNYLNYRYYIGMITQPTTIEPGANQNFESTLYAGPKIQKDLEKLAPGLELTVDYGWLTVIAKPLFWILSKIHSITNNWGWAIILLTLLIKLVFYKLSETSYRSMAHMRKLQPRMKALKDRYGDDKQKLNQAMMDMYRKEKINPLGGCLPILIQIPVFIALYWVLLESVELRQAPFILWIKDLSIKDPYYILPIIMGATMYLQQKLNPAPIDPVQAKVMSFLPIVFTVFFLFFPSGLVLYWVVNNTLSIAQQMVITKRVEQGQE